MAVEKLGPVDGWRYQASIGTTKQPRIGRGRHPGYPCAGGPKKELGLRVYLTASLRPQGSVIICPWPKPSVPHQIASRATDSIGGRFLTCKKL